MKSYTEKTIPEPGWYFWYPQYPEAGRVPQFIKVEEDTLEGKWLECKGYAGSYYGPYDIPAAPVEYILVAQGLRTWTRE